MLTRFEVSNFKNFQEKFTFDLTKTKSYEFHPECVKDGVVQKALIYGENGCGKSNLGFAIFDLVSHLTSNNFDDKNYDLYENAFAQKDLVEFSLEFLFERQTVKYQYGKNCNRKLVYERLEINDSLYVSIDRRHSNIAQISLPGTETLKNDFSTSEMSVLSYIKNNALLDTVDVNKTFLAFMDFVNRILFFRSLQTKDAIGFMETPTGIGAKIISSGNLKAFEQFLNEAGINCKLTVQQTPNGEDTMAFDMGGKNIYFYSIASTGTHSLALFYFWYIYLREQKAPSLVFIDEFDAFYHHSLSALVIKKLKEVPQQVILTTHNTSIMTNDLLRPDCYFLMNNQEIKSLAHCTPKELRFAHNIEKMYKAGSFSV